MDDDNVLQGPTPQKQDEPTEEQQQQLRDMPFNEAVNDSDKLAEKLAQFSHDVGMDLAKLRQGLNQSQQRSDNNMQQLINEVNRVNNETRQRVSVLEETVSRLVALAEIDNQEGILYKDDVDDKADKILERRKLAEDEYSYNGDKVLVTIEAFNEKNEREGKYSVPESFIGVGSGTLVKEIENLLLGVKPHTKFTETIEFPENHQQQPELNGRKLTFNITVETIKRHNTTDKQMENTRNDLEKQIDMLNLPVNRDVEKLNDLVSDVNTAMRTKYGDDQASILRGVYKDLTDSDADENWDNQTLQQEVQKAYTNKQLGVSESQVEDVSGEEFEAMKNQEH